MRLALGDGAELRWPLPEAAREEVALPDLDVSAVPGARVTARVGFVLPDGPVLRGACVRAPSDRWAPGVEELVLGRATGVAQALVAPDVSRWEPGAIEAAGRRFEERIHGEAPGARVELRHILGFVGPDRDAALCTLACRESLAGDRCAPLLDAAAAEGAFVEAPPPSLMVRAIFAAAEHPYEAAALAGALAIGATALVLWKRPRPRN